MRLLEKRFSPVKKSWIYLGLTEIAESVRKKNLEDHFTGEKKAR